MYGGCLLCPLYPLLLVLLATNQLSKAYNVSQLLKRVVWRKALGKSVSRSSVETQLLKTNARANNEPDHPPPHPHPPLPNQLLRLVFGLAFTQPQSKWAFLDQGHGLCDRHKFYIFGYLL